MANVPTTSWDETIPSNSESGGLGDDRIRELKAQIRQVIDVDHDFPSSGQASDVGQHKKVTLQEQADLGTGAVSATILGNQTYNGKGELTYIDEDDNDIRFTEAGAFNMALITGSAPDGLKVDSGNISGVIAVTKGGTGLSSVTAGDILYASASNTISSLAKGTASQVLAMKSDATIPEWTTNEAAGTLVQDWVSLAEDANGSYAHGLAAAPSRVLVSYKGSSAGGTPFGDEPTYGMVTPLEVGSGDGCSVNWDDSNVYVRWNTWIAKVIGTGGSQISIETSVEIKVTAWL